MHAILNFLQFLINAGLEIVVWLVIAYAIMSWLVGFDVINLRNRNVWRISRLLESIVRPLLAPFRRFIPAAAGLDFSPLILLLLIVGAQRYLVPELFRALHSLVGPTTTAL